MHKATENNEIPKVESAKEISDLALKYYNERRTIAFCRLPDCDQDAILEIRLLTRGLTSAGEEYMKEYGIH